jgi:hypothetical protein
MGMAVQVNCIAVGIQDKIWFFMASPEMVPNLQPRGQYDACYLARYTQFMGDLFCHELFDVQLIPGCTFPFLSGPQWSPQIDLARQRSCRPG